MSRAEPTAGEWHLIADGIGDRVGAGKETIGEAMWLGPNRDTEMCANARLFAASKDLLAACEAALKWATYWDTNEQAKRDADTIRAAIAKAKGEP